MREKYDVKEVVIKWLRQDILSVGEQAVLDELLATTEGRELLMKFKEEDWVRKESTKLNAKLNDALWNKILTGLRRGETPEVRGIDSLAYPKPRINRGLGWKIAAAVVVLLASAAAYWGLTHPTIATSKDNEPNIAVAGLPGGDRAILTLADGRQINLDSSANGLVADQGNVTISKTASGQLAYKTLVGKPIAPGFNILTTPRAGQFSLALPDGSKVWLNNGSSLRYPVYFRGDIRNVELKGEGYFEIAKNPKMPFTVDVRQSGAGDNGGSVQVLGTSFNIMAYPDENEQRTTLVTGSLGVTGGKGQDVILNPGDQAVLDATGNSEILHHVNAQEVTAWTAGYFHFNHSGLESTMRQLVRWYDIDQVIYEDKARLSGQEFTGKIQRNLPLEVVLKGLQNEHVHFKLDGRILTVLP